MVTQQTERLSELVRGMETAMLCTVGPDGIRSRPMVVQDFDFDGDLWFFTQKSSGKVEDIEAHEQVGIVFMEPDSNRYLSILGVATVLDDLVTLKRVWRPVFAKWFPDGPGDDVAAIRVRVQRAEYWDTPHSELVESFVFPQPRPQRPDRSRPRIVRPLDH